MISRRGFLGALAGLPLLRLLPRAPRRISHREAVRLACGPASPSELELYRRLKRDKERQLWVEMLNGMESRLWELPT